MRDEIARIVIEAMKSSGIDFVVDLPSRAFKALNEMVEQDSHFIHVAVGNEGDGVAICGGAWLGGKKPAMIMENSGLFLSSYALARSAITFGFPMLLLMSYRGQLGEARWFSMVSGWATEAVLDDQGGGDKELHRRCSENSLFAPVPGRHPFRRGNHMVKRYVFTNSDK